MKVDFSTRALRSASSLLAVLIFAQFACDSANGNAAQATPGGGTLRALLIGVNKYESLPSLRGAVNDVELLSSVLTTRFGFPAKNIHTLTDGDATRDGILAAIDALAAETGPQDIVYLHYSGHGSQVTDMNGDEEDGFDETLVPSNGRTANVRDITDDELAKAFSKFPTRNLVVVLDSCHSGTATRSISVQARAVPRDQRTDIYDEVATRAVVPLVEGDLVLMTGAASEEEALDGPVDGRPHGLFSYALAQSLSHASADVTPRDVLQGVEVELERIKAQLGLRSMPEPQLEATPVRLDAALLAGAPSEPAASGTVQVSTPIVEAARLPWVTVVRIGPGMARLVGGRALGARPGSTWGIYGSGETAFAPGKALASAQVTELEGDDVIAMFTPADVALPSGARAIEVAPPSTVDKLDVYIALDDASARKKLQQNIASQLPVVNFVGEDEFARYRVEGDGSDIRVLAADGVSEIARYSDLSNTELVSQLAAFFARSMTASELLALDNPATAMSLELSVGSTEREGGAADTPMRGMVIAETSAPIYRIRKAGDPRTSSNSLQLSVTPSADCYLTVVDVDSEGNILLLFPNSISEARGYVPGGKLSANETIQIPDSLQPGNRAGFHIDYAPPIGTDTVRAFCSVDETIAQALRDSIGALGSGSGGAAASRGVVRETLTGSVRDTLTLAMTRGLKLVADVPEPEVVPEPEPEPVIVAEVEATPEPAALVAATPAPTVEVAALPDWVASSLTIEIAE